MSPATLVSQSFIKRQDSADEISTSFVKSVLFVCWGNVCRSPAAKSVFEQYLKTRKLHSLVQVDSAGVCIDDNPTAPSRSMRWAAYRRGYQLKRRARRVLRTDLNWFDLVVAMDRKNLFALGTVHANPKSTIKLLSDFLPDQWPRDVPDPMNRSKRTCNKVLDMLELACPKIVAELSRVS